MDHYYTIYLTEVIFVLCIFIAILNCCFLSLCWQVSCYS